MLARPEGNPAGGGGLALFYLETRDESGHLCNIRINRLIEQAQWSIDNERDGRARAAARRFARSGVDLILDVDPADSLALANDEPLPAG